MSHEKSGVYAVVAEFKNEGPIIMETEASGSGRIAARERALQLMSNPRCVRVIVCELVPDRLNGNQLVLQDMIRLQKEPSDD